MGFNKKEKAAFLKIVDDCATIMRNDKHKQLVLFMNKPLYQGYISLYCIRDERKSKVILCLINPFVITHKTEMVML